MARGDRRKLFARQYVYGAEPGNATAAATAAGYAAASAFVTGSRLLNNAKVLADIDRLTAERNAAIQATGIADQQYRFDAANDRHHRMQRLLAERAADDNLTDIPGGSTGLLVRKPVLVKVYEASRGEDAGDDDLTPTRRTVLTYEYAFDAALVKEMRELEKQVAQDAGQWTEKRELAGKDGGPIGIALIDQVIADGGDAEP